MTEQAGAQPVAGANNATVADKTSTASSDTSTQNNQAGSPPIAATPEEIAEWKAAYEKKTTNADKHFTKRSQELAAKIKAAEERETQLGEYLNQIKNQKGPAAQAKVVENILGYEGDDPEVLSAISTVEQIIEKKVGPQLETLKKELAERQAKEQSQAQAVRATEIRTQAEKILDTSSLEKEDKGFFVNYFVGKYDVDKIPVADEFDHMGNTKPGLYSLFAGELKAYEKMLKDRGLLANKEYVDKKSAANKNLRTDTKGSSGRETEAVDWKSMKGREKKNAKLDMLTQIVAKYQNPPK
jgi:hypothetical protein